MLFNRLSALLRRDLAIDLGTAATRVALPGEGVVVDEPSVVAVPRAANRVLASRGAVGHLARQMLGRSPDSVNVVRPLKAGVIADIELCEAMLRQFIERARPTTWAIRPRVLMVASACLTSVEKQAVFRCAQRAGAGQVMLLSVAHAAALGAELPIAEPTAGMIVDIGAGATEVAVFSLGDIVAQRAMRVGGDHMDTAIVEWLRRQRGLRVGLSTAEELRIDVADCAALGSRGAAALSGRSHEVCGVDVASGLPRRELVSPSDLAEALAAPLESIAEGIRATLDGCTPDLVADLVHHGMLLCGGGALLRGLCDWLSQRIGIAARVAPNALTASIEGALVCLEHLDAWRSLVESRDWAA